MTVKEATANIFMTAFQALPKDEQNAIIVKMIQNAQLREDLIDLAIAETKSNEKPKSFRKFLAKIKKERTNQ